MEDQSTAPGAQPPAHEVSGRDRPPARIVLTGIALVFLVWFAVANFQHVPIRFWVSTTHAPLIVVIIISAALGAAASGLWSRLRRRRHAGRPGD